MRNLASKFAIAAIAVPGLLAPSAGWASSHREAPFIAKMPKVDGIGLARAIKADAKLRGVPIIFLTARTAVSDHVAAMEAGARSYLGKPFSIKDLSNAVSRATRRGPART